METGSGLLSRVAERALGWVALGLVALGAIAVYQLPAETKAAIWSGAWRSTAWLLLAAAVPWSGWFFVRHLMAVGSNWAGVIWLAILSLVDIGLGLSLMTAWPGGVWSWAAVLGLLTLTATYNYLVTDYLADTSTY